MRRPYVGGNWKMNLHRQEAVALAQALADQSPDAAGVDVTVCPAMPYVLEVAQVLQARKSPVKVGAQDFYFEKNGAFTGEVSLSMLEDIGARVVLVGHSERRHVMGEGDTLINEKLLAALEAGEAAGGMEVILCIGETLEQRESNKTDAINRGQLAYGLAGVRPDQMSRVTIAYEPVWAIGTGKTATPEDAQKAHAAIRSFIGSSLFDPQVADAVRIQYGGSVKPANAAALISQPDIDGFLVGGASLKADDFSSIVGSAGAGG